MMVALQILGDKNSSMLEIDIACFVLRVAWSPTDDLLRNTQQDHLAETMLC